MKCFKSLISIALILFVALSATDDAFARRRSGRPGTAPVVNAPRVNIVHPGALGLGNGIGGFSNQRQGFVTGRRHPVVATPAFSYNTYTRYDPYRRRNYRYHDQGGYRYYRRNDGSILGRVLLGVIANALGNR